MGKGIKPPKVIHKNPAVPSWEYVIEKKEEIKWLLAIKGQCAMYLTKEGTFDHPTEDASNLEIFDTKPNLNLTGMKGFYAQAIKVDTRRVLTIE